MSLCTIAPLDIYPVKGCQGLSVSEVEVRRDGIVGDRQLMMVKDSANYAQRDHPKLATIAVRSMNNGVIGLDHSVTGPFDHHIRAQGDDLTAELILEDVATLDQGDEIADWVCDAMGEAGIRVVSLPKSWDKWVPKPARVPMPEFAAVQGKPQGHFYDIAPILVESLESLADLNRRATSLVTMDRFRPSIVIAGLAPYAEDNLASLSGVDADLSFVTVCERCIAITTDQRTGLRLTKEPMKTLSKYRRRSDQPYASGVVLGAYMTVEKEGRLQVGEALTAKFR